MLKKFIMGTALIAMMGVSACASNKDYYYGEVYDPYESYNRAMFKFNEGVDYVILDPVTKAYRFVVPWAFRAAISNVLDNLKSPLYLANELLQGDWDDALIVTERFVFNTFTGFGGILDTASWEGITYEPEDFGQTLAVWGVGSGPYLVLPIIGPSTVRDAFGLAVDTVSNPVTNYLSNTDRDGALTTYIAATVLTTKDKYLDLQNDLKENSLDYYAAMRSVWMQRRQALINDNNAVSYDEYE